MMNFIKTIACVFALCIMSILPSFAQNAQVVRGKIVDKRTKNPIAGVSVTEIDADTRIIKGTATDIDGNYVLKISNPQNKLNTSYIGYKTVSQNINGRTNINFQFFGIQ